MVHVVPNYGPRTTKSTIQILHYLTYLYTKFGTSGASHCQEEDKNRVFRSWSMWSIIMVQGPQNLQFRIFLSQGISTGDHTILVLLIVKKKTKIDFSGRGPCGPLLWSKDHKFYNLDSTLPKVPEHKNTPF